MTETPLITSLTFIVYIAATFVLAGLSHRLLSRKSFMGEYFLGSRGLGSWALAFTFAATSASGGSFTGFPSLIYAHGWILALWIASYMIVPICTMGVMGKRLNQAARKTGAITIPDVLRDRFESTALGLFATCTIIFFITSNLVAQFRAGALILQTTFNLSRSHSLVPGVEDGLLIGLFLFAVVVIFYTAYGGFRAVVWTDVMQGIVMGFGVLLLVPLILSKAGGLTEVTKSFEAEPPFTVTALEGGNNDLAFLLNEEIEPEKQPVGVEFIAPGPARSEPAVALMRSKDDELWIQITVATDAAGRVISVADDIRQLVLSDSEIAPLLVDVINAYDNNGEAAWDLQTEKEVSKRWRFIRGEEFLFGPGRTSTGAPFHTLGLAISFFFMWAISGMGQPGTMVRLMAFRDSRTLKRAIVTVTIYYALIYLPLVFIFVASRTQLKYLSPENYDSAMALVATRVISEDFFTAILAAIMVAAPFAAVMSTVDSFLLMTSSSLVRDVYQRTINPNISERAIKLSSYTTTAVVGIAVTFLAMRPIDFLQNIIVFTGAGFASTFLFPVFLGLYWKRMTRAGALASMVGGFLLAVVLFSPTWMNQDPIYLFGFHPVVWGLGGSLFLAIVVSLLSGPPPEHLVRTYFQVPKQS